MLTLPILVAGLLAAASPPRLAGDFECPSAGGPAWREVQTAHFVVQTNLSSGKAQALAREVERLYEVLLHAMFKSPPAFPGKVRVVALQSDAEFDLFAPKGIFAFYQRGGLEGPTMVVPGYMDTESRRTIAHELTHHVAARIFLRQSHWFSEGLASYMETLGSSGPGNSPTVGGANQGRFRSVFPWHGGLARVFEEKTKFEHREYGQSWALVFYLFNRQPAAFADLQRRYSRGQDPAQAWREVFPQWDPARPGGMEALDDEVGRFLANGKYGYRDVQLPPEQEVTERPLDAAAAHRIRLSLPWLNRGEKFPKEAFQAELDEALRHDPGHVLALRLSSFDAKDAAAKQALGEKAVAAHPEDGRAWSLLADTLGEGAPERRLEAQQKAAALLPEDGTAQNNLAWALLEAGRSGEALPLARKAVALEPWSPPVLDTLAAVLDDLGQCGPALAAQQRACDLLGEGYPEAAKKSYLDRLAGLEKQCGAKAP